MPRLQKYLTKDKDISGKKVPAYYNYRITVPANIADIMSITEGQRLHAILDKNRKSIHIRQTIQSNSKQITARVRRTRHYRGMPCFVTEIILPIEFVRELQLKKGQELHFDTYERTIIISQ